MAQDSVVHCIADAGTILDYAETVNALVDECKLHMSGDGWHVSAVDPANVAMVDYADLAPRAFEAYDAPGSVTVGLNLIRFLDLVDPASSGELVELNVNMETRKLEIGYGATSHSMRLIDPESIRTEPDTPDLDLHNTVTLTGKDFAHAFEMCDLTGESVHIRGNVDGRQVEFASEGDVDESTVEYGDEDVIDAKINSDDVSIFSLDYLEDMVKPVPADTEVTLRFADEFPMRFEWESAEGAMNVRMMLAPRIQSS